MQSSIWKFPIETKDEQIIAVPAGAEFLSVQVQRGKPCIWAKVNTQEKKTILVRVAIVGTGNPASHADNMTFVGTYQLYNGDFVGHVFIGLD